MLFEIDKDSLIDVRSTWRPKELAVERFIVSAAEDGARLLNESVFGEELLLIQNQVRTRAGKWADIFALDKAGRGVIIELKRDVGHLGVETQALQYLADFSQLQGEDFVRHFAENPKSLTESIKAHCGSKFSIDEVNKSSRIILVARNFDRTIYSMGEWLSSQGVPFRCIAYSPVEIEGRQFISFSTTFDQSSHLLFPVSFRSTAREPGYYWHNIAHNSDRWWDYLVESKEIPACFKDEPDDKGERLLRSYIKGDTIVAYAKGYGAIGWGTIEKPSSYRLLSGGDPGDQLDGTCLHRLSINWCAVAQTLADGVTPDIVRTKFNIYHPLSTSVSIDPECGRQLVKYLTETFGSGD